MGSTLAGWLSPWLFAVSASLFAVQSHASERTLSLYNMNTGESLQVVYKRNGSYLADGVRKLDWFLRDWRKGVSIKMDRRLYDVVWEVYRNSGATEPIHVHSGYRSEATNSLLRKRSRAVAKHSQHIEGAAMDFHIPGVSASRLREIAMKLQDGGVGYYRKANNPFVHVDVGRVRHWPRMSRKQLAALFPDGRSLHVPSDGKSLPGFKEALGKIAADAKEAVSEVASLMPDVAPRPSARPDISAGEPLQPASPKPTAQESAVLRAAAFVPSQDKARNAFEVLMAPASPTYAAPRSGPISRMPLPALAQAGRPSLPAMRDLGPGKKGPRLVPPRAWKIGGYL